MHFSGVRRIYIHPSLPILLLLSFLSPAFRLFRLTLFFSVLHEGFHALGALCLGVSVRRLSIYPYGCSLRLSRADALVGAQIAACGPLGSFLLFLFFRVGDAGKINLLLCLFNLLPALPLDGGRLLRLFLLQHTGTYYVRKRLRLSGKIIGALLLLAASILPSVSCAFVGLLLLFFRPLPEAAPFSAHKKAVPLPKSRIFCIRPEDSLLRLCRRFSPFYYAYFFLPEKGVLVSEADIIRVLGINAAARADSLFSPTLPPGTGRHPPVSPE